MLFFLSLTFIPQTQKQSFHLLNAEIYKRPANEDCSRPNPLILLVNIDKNIHLTLNHEEITLTDLEAKLSEVFKFRQEFYVTDEKEIEKTVFIQADDSVKYEELVKIIDLVAKSGANHIFIDPFKQ